MAPATRISLSLSVGHIYVTDVSSSNYADIRGEEEHQETRIKIECVRTCTKGPRVGPTSRAYSDADPGLVCPIAAAAAAAAADDSHYSTGAPHTAS